MSPWNQEEGTSLRGGDEAPEEEGARKPGAGVCKCAGDGQVGAKRGAAAEVKGQGVTCPQPGAGPHVEEMALSFESNRPGFKSWLQHLCNLEPGVPLLKNRDEKDAFLPEN